MIRRLWCRLTWRARKGRVCPHLACRAPMDPVERKADHSGEYERCECRGRERHSWWFAIESGGES